MRFVAGHIFAGKTQHTKIHTCVGFSKAKVGMHVQYSEG